MVQSDIKKIRARDSLANEIRQQIANGILAPGSYLLPERGLVQRYGLSLRAVREALALLESERLIRREQGRGTIVLDSAAPMPAVRPASQQQHAAVIFQGRVRDAATAEMFDALQQAFHREGYGTLLHVADGNPNAETQIVAQLVASGVPGVVLFSSHSSTSDSHLKAALAAGVKLSLIDHDFPSLDCNFVGIDDELAAYDATMHLIRLGCRELICVVSGSDWTTHVLREQGFRRAVQESGTAAKSHVVRMVAGPSMEERRLVLQREFSPILRSAEEPVGTVVWWDEIALAAIDVFQQAGWPVPTRARVIGFGNDRRGTMAGVPLTTMEIPRQEIMSLAATLLVRQMRDPSRAAQRIRLKSRMVLRESCGTYAHMHSLDEIAGTGLLRKGSH